MTALRVLRVYHSGVVSEWRTRDRELRAHGVEATLVGSVGRLEPDMGVRVPISPGLTERFGRVAGAATVCGVAVVTSDTGSLPEVGGGAGVLVSPDDAIAQRPLELYQEIVPGVG